MKKIATIILILGASLASAQPCKIIKPGMTKQQVIKSIGKPASVDVLGVDNGTDTLILWNYGNQQVAFSGKTVDRVVADVKRETALVMEMSKGKISKEEFSKRLEKINNEACK